MAKSMNVGAAMLGSYDTPAGASAAKESPVKPKRGAGHVDRIEITVADNGGFMVTCSCKPGKGEPYSEPAKHAFEDPASMLKFVAKAITK